MKDEFINDILERQTRKRKLDPSFLDQALSGSGQPLRPLGSDFLDEFFDNIRKTGYTPVMGIISKYMISNMDNEKAIKMMEKDDSGETLNKIFIIDKLVSLEGVSEKEIIDLFDAGIGSEEFGDYLLIHHKDYLIDSLKRVVPSEKDPNVRQCLMQATALDVINNGYFEDIMLKIVEPEDMKTLILASNACRGIDQKVNLDMLIEKVNRDSYNLNMEISGNSDVDRRFFLYFRKAKKLFDEGNLDSCERFLARVVAGSPLSVDAIILYAELLYKKSRFDEALSEVNQIISLAGKEGPAYENLATMRLRLIREVDRNQFRKELKDYIAMFGQEKAESIFGTPHEPAQELEYKTQYLVSIHTKHTGGDNPFVYDFSAALQDSVEGTSLIELAESIDESSKPRAGEFKKYVQSLNKEAKICVRGKDYPLDQPVRDLFAKSYHGSKEFMLLEGAIVEKVIVERVSQEILDILGG